MKLILRDKSSSVVDAWREAFSDDAEVDISWGDIFEKRAQAIISPANSYGWMNGGIDYYYTLFFGAQLQDRLQAKIIEFFKGELPVGEAIILHTGSKEIPLLISCPTMRLPDNVAHTQNAYLAFKAGLWLAKENGVESVLSPGMCTLTGGMSAINCAKQMKKAWDEIITH